jgi:poly-gamma-glutamate synthesis protein (capsule biosynthesis protein)
MGSSFFKLAAKIAALLRGGRVIDHLSSRRRIAALTLVILGGCATASRVPAPANAVGSPSAKQPPALPPGGGRVAPPPAPEAPVLTLARVTIGAVGDVLMHDAVKRSAELHGAGAPDAGFAWLFAPIADLLSEPDVTFANLETPIAPRTSQGARPFVFNAPPAVIRALQRAGVDLVSVANNHAFDQGRPGFEETLQQLSAAAMTYVGAGPSSRPAGPVRIERNGLSLAFLGYTYGLNQSGNDCPPPRPGARECLQAAEIDGDRIVEEVRAAAAEADAVVVSVHWGVEYEQQPRAEGVDLAHRIADAGALVILGHHPHVLQPVELYRRADGRAAVIAYSLGNFISNQSRNYVPGVSPDRVAAPRDGALLRIALARRDYGRGVVRVEVAGADFTPLWTENDTAEIDRRREPGRRPAIRVVSVERALAEVRSELAGFPDPVPADAQDRWVRLRQREALYLARRSAVSTVLGEDLLRPLAPGELVPVPAPAQPPSPTPAVNAPAGQ